MPRNGTGTYSLPQPPFVAGTVISSAAVNSDLTDIASALTGSLPRDGQAGMIGPLLIANGSLIAPSLSFTNDDTTGFYSPGSGQIGIVIEGTQLGIFSSTGLAAPVASGVPIGMGGDFYGTTVPVQWYLCYGQAVSRTTYALLFTAIGTTYGSGDGASTFNLPDARGTILVGSDNMGGTPANRLTTQFFGANPDPIGSRGGSQSHTLNANEIPVIQSSGSAGVTISGQTYLVSDNSTGFGLTLFSANSGAQVWQAFSNGALISQTGSLSGSGSASVTSFNAAGQPHAIVQPSLIVNKIIYAGA